MYLRAILCTIRFLLISTMYVTTCGWERGGGRGGGGLERGEWNLYCKGTVGISTVPVREVTSTVEIPTVPVQYRFQPPPHSPARLPTHTNNIHRALIQEVCSLWRLNWILPYVCMCQLTGQPYIYLSFAYFLVNSASLSWISIIFLLIPPPPQFPSTLIFDSCLFAILYA